MAKNTIRLTESELKKVISESVERVLNEGPNFWNGNGLGYGMELHNRKQARSFPMRSKDHDANNARIAELEMGGIRGMIRKVYELHQRYEHMHSQSTMTHRFDDERFVDLDKEMQNVRDEAKNILEKLSTHLDDERVISLYNDPKLQNWIRSITRKRLTPSNNYKSFESLTDGVREELVSNKINPKVALIRLMKLGHSKEDAIKIVRLTLQMMRGEQ
jgi:hypothetical protein